VRAAQTARGICSYLEYDDRSIDWRADLYLAGLDQLLEFLAQVPPEYESLMLVGHNPGLQHLLDCLAAPRSLPANASMPTAAVARLEVTEDWDFLQPRRARLVYLIKPE
jgi:phosphohistidine phosphatase